MDSNKAKTLILEGNVGAGKSTFLGIIGKYLDVQLVYEPHEKWQNLGTGDNLLDKFYNDTKRWAYTFQTYAFVTRVLEQEEQALKRPGGVQVLERSVFSDRYCFARNCYEMGVMSPLEWRLYQEWFSWLVDRYVTKPVGFIYLKTSPEVCYQRMCKRNRSEESSVSLNYLKMLHAKHEEWLVTKKGIANYLRDIPVLVLECNKEFEQDEQEQERHMNCIIDFFDLVPGITLERHPEKEIVF
ncbi:deoxynucleoside kinase [Candidatus Babeliales bacterium]|nr:deoxynucleoside kinase [Candidatus Babeliales bacterium]